jgi:flagellar motor switch protein FliN/FliY
VTTDLAMDIDLDAVVDAAGVLIDLFGLGDHAEPFEDWPVDDGDRVLQAHVTGDADLTVYLAVNEGVSRRLLHDPTRLAHGLLEAVTPAVGGGANLEIGEVEPTTESPSAIVGMFDGTQLCALFGVTVHADVADADVDADAAPGGAAAGPAAGVADGAAGVPVFEPMSLQGGGGGFAIGAGPLELLHDVEMEVTVELGRTRLPIKELLTLQPGMVVELERAAGAPIDVLVNGRRIASGEVVVVDEEFGIRIVEIVPAHEA